MLLLLALVVSIPGSVFARELPRARPETVGLSSRRLDRLRRFALGEIEETAISRVVTLVARRGRVAQSEALGMADIDPERFLGDPAEELILISMTNVSPYDLDQRWYVKTLVYQAIVE